MGIVRTAQKWVVNKLKIKTMKHQFKRRVKYLLFDACQTTFRYIINPVRFPIARAWDKIMYKPIYFTYWSRDCDMYEVSYNDVFTKGKKAFKAMQESAIDGADGLMSWTIISKSEYMEQGRNRTHRDRAMEAYENGRGNSIYV